MNGHRGFLHRTFTQIGLTFFKIEGMQFCLLFCLCMGRGDGGGVWGACHISLLLYLHAIYPNVVSSGSDNSLECLTKPPELQRNILYIINVEHCSSCIEL